VTHLGPQDLIDGRWTILSVYRTSLEGVGSTIAELVALVQQEYVLFYSQRSSLWSIHVADWTQSRSHRFSIECSSSENIRQSSPCELAQAVNASLYCKY
jgi:hypothetical protein